MDDTTDTSGRALSRRAMLGYVAAAGSTMAVLPYATSLRATAAVAGVVIDNADATLEPAAAWSTSTHAQHYYGKDYVTSRWAQDSAAVVRWIPDLPAAGSYVVEVWLPDGDGNRSRTVPYRIRHNGQEVRAELDQTVGGGYWLTLTEPLDFLADGTEYVELRVADAVAPVVHVNADAARFVEPLIPPAPAGLAAEWIPGGEVALSWEPVTDASYYALKRASSPDGPYETVLTPVLTERAVDTAAPAEDLVYAVVAVGPGGESERSTPVALPLPPRPVTAPTVTAVAGNQQVTLNWNPVDGASHYLVAGGAGGDELTVLADRVVRHTFTVGHQVNGRAGRFVVTAASAGGAGPDSAEQSVTPLGPPLLTPRGLLARSHSGRVELSWHPTADADRYLVQRAAGTSSDYRDVATVSQPSYVDREVRTGTTYRYAIRAVNQDGRAKRAGYPATVSVGSSLELALASDAATTTGTWRTSTVKPGYRGSAALVAASGSGSARATYSVPAGVSGEYSVWVSFPHGGDDVAGNAPFTVTHAGGTSTIAVDQRGAGGFWHRLGDGTYTLDGSAGHGVTLSNAAGGVVVADGVRFLPAADTPAAFGVDWSDPRQQLEGLGVEVLFDCLSPGGQEVCTVERVPQSLIPRERQRWYTEMLAGFRHIRLAMGLYLRGLDEEQRLIVDRYPGQIDDIAELAERSRTVVTPTYWSPAPYFKSTDSLLGGGLERFDASLLGDLADAMSADVATLKDHGVPVGSWSLQNEPHNRPPNVSPGGYSMCYYSPEEYVRTLNTVGARIRSDHPELHLFGADSGRSTGWIEALTADDYANELLECWSWHTGTIHDDPDELLSTRGTFDNLGDRGIVNTEFSYSGGDAPSFVNTVKSILSHFVFYQSPTWYWLHALQPTNSGFAQTRALGVWRPSTDTEPDPEYAHLPVGEWEFVAPNWNALAGFVKLIPHDATRYPVLGDSPADVNLRLMGFQGPAGERGLVALNAADSSRTVEVAVGAGGTFTGYGFTEADRFAGRGTQTGRTLTVDLAARSLEFWVTETEPARIRRLRSQ